MRTSTTLAYMLASFTLGAAVVLVDDWRHDVGTYVESPTTVVNCSPEPAVDDASIESEEPNIPNVAVVRFARRPL